MIKAPNTRIDNGWARRKTRVYTLIKACKLNGVNPASWGRPPCLLFDVLCLDPAEGASGVDLEKPK
ncbi:MAG: hypothetical protein ACI9ND_002154 [Yoonia sp.]|jgi:hypothetical protein